MEIVIKVPKGVLARSKELLKTASKIGAKELQKRVSANSDIAKKVSYSLEQAQIAAESMGRLKGAAMKVGQMLSLDSSDLLPPEMKKVFEPLQNSSATAISYSRIQTILKKELEQSSFNQIKNLSQKPLAAASIGQVHTADYKGKKIAIKVQYPGISKTIDSDLRILKNLVKGTLLVSSKKIQVDPLFEELSKTLKMESNYFLEAQNLKEYQSLLPKTDGIVFPVLKEDLLSERVIAFDFIDSLTISEWLQTNPAQNLKDKISHLLLLNYCQEFFHHGIVQSDPNPSNFLIEKNTGNLVLIDFGAVKKYDRTFIVQYVELLKSVLADKRNESIDKVLEMNMIQSGESPETLDALFNMIQASVCVFNAKNQPFDFSDEQYLENTKKTARTFMQKVSLSAPPKELIFLHRKLGGLFLILKELNFQADLSPYLHYAFNPGSQAPSLRS